MPTNNPSPSSHSPNFTSRATPHSYADKARPKIPPLTDFQYPKDDQGIVFNAIRDYRLRDYLVAIKDPIGGPQNVIAISKVSGNRIVLFLKNAEIADAFIGEQGGFTMNEDFIECRKLKAPTKKIIFSNVSPTIPNEILQQYITNELSIKILSGISILRVNPVDQIFGHVISFRRQIYTSSDVNVNTLPGSFELTHEDRTHRIFITFDEFSCFKCRSKGHRAEDCPNTENCPDNLNLAAFTEAFPPLKSTDVSVADAVSNLNGNHSTPPTSVADSTKTPTNEHIPINLSIKINKPANADITDDRPNESTKRPLSTTSTSTNAPKSSSRKKRSKNKRTKTSDSSQGDESESGINGEDDTNTDDEKSNPLSILPDVNIKIQNPPLSSTDSNMETDDTNENPNTNGPSTPSTDQNNRSLKEIFAPLEDNMKRFATRYPLNLTNLSLFIDMCKDNKQAAIIAKDFTSDLKGLVVTLKENHKFLTDIKMKIKFTKIIHRLEAEISASREH